MSETLPSLPNPLYPADYFGGVAEGAYTADQMHAYAAAAAAAERERCARVCEDLDKEYECDSLYAEAIRAQVPSAPPTAEPR